MFRVSCRNILGECRAGQLLYSCPKELVNEVWPSELSGDGGFLAVRVRLE